MGKVRVISIYAHDLDQAAEFYSGVLSDSIKTLKARGVGLIHEAPQDFPEGQFIAFRDPSGNVHELLEFKN